MLVAEDFNKLYNSVRINTAAASIRLAERNIFELSSRFSTLSPNSTGELFNFRPVPGTEIQRIILSTPSNNSPGSDKINPRVIKECFPVMLVPPPPLTCFVYFPWCMEASQRH